MNMNDLVMISVDDHAVEPPDMFEKHVPLAYKSAAPKLVQQEKGFEAWVYEGRVIPNVATNAVVGRPREEYGMEPINLAQLRKGTYDVHARIDDMNACGWLASLNFPNFPGVAGKLWLDADDKKTALIMLQAYNDWNIDDWSASYPGRFIPCSMIPLWDPQLAVEEIKRVSAKGVHAISFLENPVPWGLPSFQTDYWNPVWKACCDYRIVPNLHIGSGGGFRYASMDAPIDAAIATMPMTIADNAAALLWSPVLRKFPELRIALTEGSAGWIPYLMERSDFTYKHHSAWTHQDFGDLKPSDVFRRNFLGCFISDRHALQSRDVIGVDNLLWELDYPHSDTTWPDAPEAFMDSIEGIGMTAEEIDKVTHLNAMREYSFDPFAALGGRANCTVGALRAQAKHVDVTPKSQGGMRPSSAADGVVTSADIIKQLSMVDKSQAFTTARN